MGTACIDNVGIYDLGLYVFVVKHLICGLLHTLWTIGVNSGSQCGSCGFALDMWTIADVMDNVWQFMDTVWQFLVYHLLCGLLQS